jgi:hypothetical protein
MDKVEIYHRPAQNCDSWNRTLCSVLEEMRKCHETRNFAVLPGLIEEAQTYGNRMEAKLSDVRDYAQLKRRYKALRKKMAKASGDGIEPTGAAPLFRGRI